MAAVELVTQEGRVEGGGLGILGFRPRSGCRRRQSWRSPGLAGLSGGVGVVGMFVDLGRKGTCPSSFLMGTGSGGTGGCPLVGWGPPPLTGRGPVPGMTTPSQRQRLARPLVGLCLQEL